MIDLRQYQARAISEIENTNERVLYVLPTGGGKTVIATNIIERAVHRGERVDAHTSAGDPAPDLTQDAN